MALRNYQELEIWSGCTWSLMCLVCTIIFTAFIKIIVKISFKKNLSRDGDDHLVVGLDPKKSSIASNDGLEIGRRDSKDRTSSRKIISDFEYGESIIGKQGKTQRIAKKDSRNEIKILKGPLAIPVFGSLHMLAGPGGPSQAFTDMSRKYGEIYALKLGSTKCVVVSSYRLVKEVLVTKGNHFGGRPDFRRFHELFGGDRNNCKFLIFNFLPLFFM